MLQMWVNLRDAGHNFTTKINNNLHRFVNKCIKDNIFSFQEHIGLNDTPHFFNSLKHTPGETFKFSHISEGIICKTLK